MCLVFCFSSLQSFVCPPEWFHCFGELLIYYCVSLSSLYCASGNAGKLQPEKPQKQKGGTAEKKETVSCNYDLYWVFLKSLPAQKSP